jgi:hypothetical protein
VDAAQAAQGIKDVIPFVGENGIKARLKNVVQKNGLQRALPHQPKKPFSDLPPFVISETQALRSKGQGSW